MSIIYRVWEKIHSSVYNPNDDPLIKEREAIELRTGELMRQIEVTRHPKTGLTLADMAANRRSESWHQPIGK